MKSFAEFEAALLGALQQERSDLQGLQGASDAQLSAWIEHLFRQYLGYTHWKEISREGSTPIGAKGTKQLFPDLRVEVLDNGLIFVECKRLGRLDGPKGQEELADAVNQLRAYIRAYIRAHLDRAATKPKTVLGVVTDGNRWLLIGLNRTNEFHTIAEWAFLTDDPRLIAQRLWLLAKPALAQPTSALVEFLARRTLAEVLKDNTKLLTRKVNERLPDGVVSEDLIARWLRDALPELAGPPRVLTVDTPAPAPPSLPVGTEESEVPDDEADPGEEVPETPGRRVTVGDLLAAGLLLYQDRLVVEGVDGRSQAASITPEGKINVAGQLFDSVSPAALKALELAGKQRKAVNGWATFRVIRNNTTLGLLELLRAKFEESQSGTSGEEQPQETATNPVLLAAVEHIKPLLALAPEVAVTTSRTAISLYSGKVLVAYVQPRRKGPPRLRVFVGDSCPDWATPDPTYAAWCYVDDWSTNLERAAALLRQAPHTRTADQAAGRDAYRRRPGPQGQDVAPPEQPPGVP